MRGAKKCREGGGGRGGEGNDVRRRVCREGGGGGGCVDYRMEVYRKGTTHPYLQPRVLIFFPESSHLSVLFTKYARKKGNKGNIITA